MSQNNDRQGKKDWIKIFEQAGITIVEDYQVSQATAWILTRSEARKLASILEKAMQPKRDKKGRFRK